MKRQLFFVLLFLLAAALWAGSGRAENQSVSDGYFVSAVRWYAGGAETGEPLTALRLGETYPSVTAAAEVQPLTAGSGTVTVLGAVRNGGTLTGIFSETKTRAGTADFTLRFTNILPDSDDFRLELFFWEDPLGLRPIGRMQVLQSAAVPPAQAAADMQRIRERAIRDYNLFSSTVNPQYLLSKLDSGGRFSDIDYASTDRTVWPVSGALSNAAELLKAYCSEGNPWYHNESLGRAIDLVLQDWADHQYKNPNWWYQEIDVPKKLTRILLYPLEDKPYLPALRQLALLGMPKTDGSLPHLAADTGANLLDKLVTAAGIAAATGDAASMEQVVTRLLDNELSVFDSANGGEGIMIDGSMHQHGALFYSGSYGSVFCTDANLLLGYLEDTCFMVSDRALNAYTDFILDGQSLLFRNGMSDFACFGRAISRSGGVGGSVKANCLGAVNILTRLPGVDRRAELLALKESRLGSADQGAVLAKHFWTSDFTVLHRENFYVSVRNSSKRNKTTEYMNNENSKAYYIADGTTVIMRTGGEYRDIFPVWDWSRIPGTTTAYLPFASIPSLSTEYGGGEFVGGADNGRFAVTAMDYSHNGVTAKKANFLFGGGFTALGAGITGTGTQAVTTTLNQCVQSGNAAYSDASGTGSAAKGDTRALTSAEWVLHDRVGYYFPEPANASLSIQEKSGSWNAINSSQKADAVTQSLFTLYLDHGVRPQDAGYSYTVLPDTDAVGLAQYAKAPDMTVLSNTKKVQAVWSAEAQSAGIVFWNQGVPNYRESVTLPAEVTGLDQNLTVTAAKDPCLVLLTRTREGWELCVSNPKNNSLAQTSITINRPLSGVGAVRNGTETTVTIPLPQGQERGRTVTVELTDAP